MFPVGKPQRDIEATAGAVRNDKGKGAVRNNKRGKEVVRNDKNGGVAWIGSP